MASILPSIAAPLGTLLGTGLGLALEGHEDERQYNQQQKLQNLQIQGQQQMATFNEGMQEKLWQDTSYEAQKEQMLKAGLNPALMYGQGGGGGVTASLATGNVSGAQAAQPSGQEPQQMAGLGIQMASQVALMQSQIEVNKSIANKNNTDATKTGGADTANTIADTAVKTQNLENLKANVKNTNAQTALTKVQTALTGITQEIQESSMTDQINTISLNAQRIQQEVNQLKNQTDISDATKETIIKTVEQNYINTIIEGNLKKSGINVNNEQITKMSQEVQQKWTSIGIDKQQLINDTLKANAISGLEDKEKSLLTTQTILQGIGAVMGGLEKGKNIMQ